MGNKMSGHDDDDMKRVKGRYAGEMLFDDEDDYDDDADDYSDDHGRTGIAKDDYSDSAFGPGADDEEDAASEEEAYTSDDEYYEDEYAEEEQDMKDQKRKKKNRVWGIILAIEAVAAIVIGVLFLHPDPHLYECPSALCTASCYITLICTSDSGVGCSLHTVQMNDTCVIYII